MWKLRINISISAAVVSIAGIVYLWYQSRKSEEIPQKWEIVGYVEKIAFYPLKSCSYRELKEAECMQLGLREIENEENCHKHLFQDRQFVIYDIKEKEVLKLIKQRKAVLISAHSEDKDTIIFRAPDVPEHVLKLSSVTKQLKCVQIGRYGAPIETVDCGDEVAGWLSRYFLNQDTGFRLGFFVENAIEKPNVIKVLSRQSKEFTSVYKHMREEDGGLYSWVTSYLVVNQSSLEDLNEKLSPEDRVNVYNLRPNIVVKGAEPYAEDNWKWIKIGENVVMRYFKPCTRCTVITINPDTAERNKNFQPFKILKSYRSVKQVKGYDLQGDLPVFGANMGLYASGKIKIGDPVYKSV